MIRKNDIPYIRAIKKLADEASGKQVTSLQVERVVADVNGETGIYYTGEQVFNIMLFCNVLSVQSHLGQPRHGQPIHGGRLHTIQVFWND